MNEPTRGPNLLDLLITNIPSIHDLQIVDAFDPLLDHKVLLAKIVATVARAYPITYKYRNFTTTALQCLNTALSSILRHDILDLGSDNIDELTHKHGLQCF